MSASNPSSTAIGYAPAATRSGSTRPLALAAAAGNGFFILVVIVLPLVQGRAYNPVRQTMSELVLGPHGWVMTTAFTVMAFGTFAFAVLLGRVLGARRLTVMFGIAGVLDLVSAAFRTVYMNDPQTPTSIVHTVAGISTFLIITAAILTAVPAMRRTPGWASYATATRWWGIASAVAFLVLGPPVTGPDHFGLGQRGMAATFMSWILVTSLRALRAADGTSSDLREAGR